MPDKPDILDRPDIVRLVNAFYTKIHRIPNPRLDPSTLTAEQKARYANYREK